jgi:hypothetical protein
VYGLGFDCDWWAGEVLQLEGKSQGRYCVSDLKSCLLGQGSRFGLLSVYLSTRLASCWPQRAGLLELVGRKMNGMKAWTSTSQAQGYKTESRLKIDCEETNEKRNTNQRRHRLKIHCESREPAQYLDAQHRFGLDSSESELRTWVRSSALLTPLDHVLCLCCV